jgi:hydroxyacylglutathione hydrolase
MSKEAFVAIVTADQPDTPDYFTYDAILNTKEHPTLEQARERSLKPLELAQVLQLKEEGAQLLDVRELADFLGGHLAGSLNIGLDGRYATWAGTLLDHDHPIVIIAEPGREEEAQTRLARIGFDHVAGYLAGGMEALEERADLVQRIKRITAATLAEQRAEPQPPAVLDVRSEKEWLEEHIEGSLNIPLNHLRERLHELPGNRQIVVHCASGYRSSTAASLLEQHGVDVADLVGGLGAWEAARLETVG